MDRAPDESSVPGAGGAAPAAEIRALLLAGKPSAAAALAARVIAAAFQLDVRSVEFTLDEYSLNSVCGRVALADGTARFFKFHQEETEESNVAEYYRTELLAAAGLPVEEPIATCTSPGRQMALYELRTEPRLADVCLDIERRDGPAARLPAPLLAARRALDRQIGEVMVSTLRPSSGASARSAIHQLYYHRLADPAGRFPGGRYRDWYLAAPAWPDLAARRWRVNGIRYDSTLAELADRAAQLLAPQALNRVPVATAHGDDHQGNIWVLQSGGGAGGPGAAGGAPAAGCVELRLFDCAFAGSDIPVLLAPAKATFHNALAHPFWLYHPAEASRRYGIEATLGPGTIDLADDAAVSPLRLEILASVVELVWAPLLGQLRQSGELGADWRDVVRSALFACPLLVTNLLAAERPEPVRLLGLARAVMAGSEPLDGTDPITRALDEMTP